MPSFDLPAQPAAARLEVLELGAAPLARHFVEFLGLPALLDRHLPPLPGPQPELPTATVLPVLLGNLLLARQPLYNLSSWAASFVPEYLGLLPAEVAFLNDDRCGRALDHLYRADRATLLTEVILRVIRLFRLDLSQLHQDTTTVTTSGDYHGQPPAEQTPRPTRICRGYNKDHRPDLKQILYNRTLTSDGGIPIHFKLHDGNTGDASVHGETWLALQNLVGSSAFLYVADSKLCSKENMSLIADRGGRFLTVMPRTRAEDARFRKQVACEALTWSAVCRRANPRGRRKPEVVYEGFEDQQGSQDGYRILWYRSSQKRQRDKETRDKKLSQTRKHLQRLRPPGRGEGFTSAAAASEAAERVLNKAGVQAWLAVHIEEETRVEQVQVGAGRPGPNTLYKEVETKVYRIRVKENREALRQSEACDGLFPLMTNDKSLTLAEALAKYKYQPYAEKRHEQLKSVFAVRPLWLKKAERVESLLWLYHVVELIQALVEREVRRQMKENKIASLPLYPENRPCKAPTTELVLDLLEGKKRYRLLDQGGEAQHTFHDPLSEVAQQVLQFLRIDTSVYGVPSPTA